MPTASRLEVACWLVAAGLALALILAPNTGPAAQALKPTAAAPAPHWTLYQQHCIERVLARAADKTEEYVVHEIDRQCIAPFRDKPAAAAGLTRLSCEPPLTLQLTAVARRVAGCLGG